MVNPLAPREPGAYARGMTSDPKNQNDSPDAVDPAEAPAGGTPDDVQKLLDEETTDENGKPLENPSGG